MLFLRQLTFQVVSFCGLITLCNPLDAYLGLFFKAYIYIFVALKHKITSYEKIQLF